jgi:N-hydroxyarylamine O-acetyltransferase
LGRPVRLDPDSLERKLIASRRGGYCFEQNGVFLHVLQALGFQVTPLAARVVWMAPPDAPRSPLSHMLLKLDLPQGPYLADVGFGGQSPTAPLRLEPGLEQTTPHGVYRVVEDPEGYEVQMRLPDRWAGMYRFRLEAQGAHDYEVFNWFTSTHPASRFTQNLIAARVVGERRLNLFNDQLTD